MRPPRTRCWPGPRAWPARATSRSRSGRAASARTRWTRPPGAATRPAERYYTRVPDVAALLERLRPVLSARLAAADRAGETGEAVVSFFARHVILPYDRGTVGPVRTGGRMQAPGVVGGAGVAPDMVGPLLFGPDGIDGLAERHPDVYPGRDGPLMSTLFPPVRADLLTFYLP